MLEPQYQEQLDRVRDLLNSFRDRFSAVQVLDENKFELLCPELELLIEMSKGKWLLPKDFLFTLYSFYSTLEDVQYSDQPQRQTELADYFTKAFNCLLSDTGMNDHQPNVPRII